MASDFHLYAGWTGLLLLSLIFLANGFGIVDQTQAIRDLEDTGLPNGLARRASTLVGAGRLLQVAAVPALFFSQTRFLGALALAGFVVLATFAAHPFWRASPQERGPQLANFLKNVALIGGLLVAAVWRGQT